MDIEAVIAALDGQYNADEAAVIERVLRAYNGTTPDDQLVSVAALALAIFRREKYGFSLKVLDLSPRRIC